MAATGIEYRELVHLQEPLELERAVMSRISRAVIAATGGRQPRQSHIFLRTFGNNASTIMGAFENGELVGVASAAPEGSGFARTPHYTPDARRLDYVVVDHDSRGQHIGTGLVAALREKIPVEAGPLQVPDDVRAQAPEFFAAVAPIAGIAPPL